MPIPAPTRRRTLTIAVLDDGREQREIAAAAGISEQALSGACTGRIRNPRPATRQAIARALGRTEHELFSDEVMA